jgi:hypothetical protein
MTRWSEIVRRTSLKRDRCKIMLDACTGVEVWIVVDKPAPSFILYFIFPYGLMISLLPSFIFISLHHAPLHEVTYPEFECIIDSSNSCIEGSWVLAL